MTEDDREAPRLQDTSERSALPLPVPGSGGSADQPAPIPGDDPPASDPPTADDGQPDLDPAFAPPAAEGFGDAEGVGAGPPPELLVGAAFLGGVALAFLVKRLAS